MRPCIADAVFVDFETHAEPKVYSLEKMSTRAYLADARFDILSVAIADESNVAVYYKGASGQRSLERARERLAVAACVGKWLVAHNTDFDGLLLDHAWKIRFGHVFDTTGYLRFLDVGYSLANGAKIVGLRKEDAPPFDASSLADPVKRHQLLRYNAKDVFITREIYRAAIADARFPDLEFWLADQTSRANLRGLCLDVSEAARLAQEYARLRDEALASLCKEFPAFDTSGLRSGPKVKKFCAVEFGIELESIDRKSAQLAMAKSNGGRVARFFELRDAFTSWAKYSKQLGEHAQGHGRIYGAVKYYGAHTGRFSAGGRDAEKLNIQNLPRGGKRSYPQLRQTRRVLAADSDESWVSCDLSTIEPRITAFLAGQTNLVERFRNGDDVYIWFTSLAFPGVQIVKGGENDHLRQLGKQAVIGLGFGMGADRFARNLIAEDPTVDRSAAERLHALYQQTFPQIVALRKAYFEAYVAAAESGLHSRVGGCSFSRVSEFAGAGLSVVVELPTGRTLFYRSVTSRTEIAPWGGLVNAQWYAPAFRFDLSDKKRTHGVGPTQKFPDGRVRARLIPHVLIENIVQATARDLMGAQMAELEQQHGLPVRFSVHDEVVVATARCVCAHVDDHDADCAWMRGRQVVKTVMSSVPVRLPGLVALPVACELSDTIRERYG